MKILIINNLSAGYRDGAIYDFIRSLAQTDNEIVLRSFEPSSATTSQLYDAESFDLVVASGGDGTVASISYTLKNTGIPILPFPAGTSNALALNLLSPNEPHALAKLTHEGRVLDFDMGQIEAGGETHGFTLIAGCGYDATIMNAAQENKQLLGPMAYFQAAFSNPNPTTSHFHITIDGETIERDGLSVLVANFSKMQFDLSLTHENLPRDGKFDILVLKTESALGLIPSFITTILDRGGNFPGRGDAVELYRGSDITVQADPALAVQYDGEVSEMTTPFRATLLPAAARYVVSEQCYEHYSSLEETS